MFPVIELGPLSLPTAPVLLLICFWIGSELAERKRSSHGKDPRDIDKILWISLLTGLLGGRFSFITRNPSAFQGQLKSLFSLSPALFDPASGLLIALAAGYFVTIRRNLGLLEILDDLVPLFAVVMPGIFIANFASGSGYGTITDLPWGIQLWEATRHPVQLYYALSGLAAAGIYFGGLLSKWTPHPGQVFFLFGVITTCYLTFFTAFQEPSGLIIADLRANQLLYWILFSLGLSGYLRIKPKDSIQETLK